MKRGLFLAGWMLLCLPTMQAQQKESAAAVYTRYYEIHGQGPDSALNALMAPYKLGVDTMMQVVVGHCDVPLTKSQPESTMGNFVADAQLSAAQAIDQSVSCAVANYGGLRIPYLAPGAITRGKVYELMPFDNTITILEIPGRVVQQFCDHMAARKGWPVSGLTFVISGDKAMDIKINGQPLNEDLTYKMAVNDYMAEGGDNCDMLRPLRRRKTTVFVRDALLQYLAALDHAGIPLHPSLENRISYAE